MSPEDVVLANPAGFRFVGQVVTEQLDFVRGHFLRRHIIRRKYAPIGNPEAAPVSVTPRFEEITRIIDVIAGKL